MSKIKCLIIDDEEPARELLGFFLDKLPDVEVLGSFKNPLEAIPLIENETADLVFLDIQMNEINGIDLIKALRHRPKIILTTAYREYAVDGFELDVADYLLKPFDFNRFFKSFNKVADQIRQKHVAPATSPSSAPKEQYLILKEGKNKHKVRLEDIQYIEGEGEYVAYHTNQQKLLILDSLKNIESTLPKSLFMRVHRSFIVNKKEVSSITSDNRLIINKREIPISGTYKQDVQDLFK